MADRADLFMGFDPVGAAWPAPYAEGLASPWIGPLLEELPLALAALDSSGRIMAGNDALMATAGAAWRPGMRPDAMVVDSDGPLLAGAITTVLRGGSAQTLRLALRERPDEPRDVRVVPVPATFGMTAILALQDIREQLRLEAQVGAATRMEAVGQLAGGVAHDFNNLLTAVLALADQLLERHGPDDPDHDALAQIRLNGQRGATLVRQLLAFARQQPQRSQLLDPLALVAGLKPLLVQLIGPTITLHVSGDPLANAVLVDPGQLEQVLINLAVNARDAMEGSGRLAIRVRDVLAADVAAEGHGIIPAQDHIAIEVTDTGSGIPDAIRGRIFQPFFTTKPQGQGTGLGLSTAYGIIKQSGGYIFAMPAPAGVGTCFQVYLPGRPAPAATEPLPPPSTPLPTPAVAARPRTVLLVEDEPAVRQVFVRGLAKRGHEVASAGDGSEALALLQGGLTPDVLVSDVMMPGMDGVELAMLASQIQPGIAIVLMSGYAELPRHRAAAAHGIHFLPKPFALADLVQAIDEAVPKPINH
ncbi:MAG: response regulator [Sphingomonadales bacterium]|jgi:two-component system cell cycle sensor histidine kinase/response regulator CckA